MRLSAGVGGTIEERRLCPTSVLQKLRAEPYRLSRNSTLSSTDCGTAPEETLPWRETLEMKVGRKPADTTPLSLHYSVRRDKAPFLSGCESRPATVAPAGSSRSGRWR